jgi:hypothetical protein
MILSILVLNTMLILSLLALFARDLTSKTFANSCPTMVSDLSIICYEIFAFVDTDGLQHFYDSIRRSAY